MDAMTANHLAYLLLSVAVTVIAGRTLHKYGRPFLVDVFARNEPIADAVNRLLLAGFYLVNIGLASWGVHCGGSAATLQHSVELVTTKLGRMLAILGMMHLFNVAVLCAVRRRKLAEPVEIVDFIDD